MRSFHIAPFVCQRINDLNQPCSLFANKLIWSFRIPTRLNGRHGPSEAAYGRSRKRFAFVSPLGVSDCMVMSVLQGLSIDRSEVQTLQGRHLFRDFSSTCNTYYITNSAKLNTLTVLYRWEDETAGTGLMRRIWSR